ncbi:unnamed protein product [Zymoseptoria tritici ST99CH_3D1]|nr:unnamed protein product [Zymoseptoria tritici ST99CH_3D1]
MVSASPGWNDETIFWNDPCIFRPTIVSPSASPPLFSSDPAHLMSTSMTPCAEIALLTADLNITSSDQAVRIPAKLGYDCLTSIPFNSSAAVQLLDSMRPYIDWQTTLAYVKDPPPDYEQKVQPPYDFWAVFEAMYSQARRGEYDSEYHFGWAIYTAFQAAHDGHFIFLPDVISGIMTFGRSIPLVSVSLDGTALPAIYALQDISRIEEGATPPDRVVMINGRDATQFLLDWASYGGLQDKDALYNNVFFSAAQVSLGAKGSGNGTFCGGGRGRWVYPGPLTTLTFANGTTISSQNFASVHVSFNNIRSGEDIYRQHFIPNASNVQDAGQAAENRTKKAPTPTILGSSSSVTANPTSIAPGYPVPVLCEMNNLNSGYFLKDEVYKDVAVLSVQSFVDPKEDELPFQAVNTQFLALATAEGKTKLIIDLSANAGGTVLQGYDLFKQLFPSILPYGASRFRAHEAFDLIGREVSEYANRVPRSLGSNATARQLLSSSLNYQTDVSQSYESFPDWATKYGPHVHNSDNFTSVQRWNMTDILTPDNSGGIYVSGYLNRSNLTSGKTAPFRPENIVIVTDGYCASTCSIFVELMSTQGKVKTIALGGRPNMERIQAVGGVKGANDQTWLSIFHKAQIPFRFQFLHTADHYRSTALGKYNNLWQFRTSLALMNVRDAILPGHDVPAHFVYQAADCRMFYTPQMMLDQSAIWQKIADTAFGHARNNCVAENEPAWEKLVLP